MPILTFKMFLDSPHCCDFKLKLAHTTGRAHTHLSFWWNVRGVHTNRCFHHSSTVVAVCLQETNLLTISMSPQHAFVSPLPDFNASGALKSHSNILKVMIRSLFHLPSISLLPFASHPLKRVHFSDLKAVSLLICGACRFPLTPRYICFARTHQSDGSLFTKSSFRGFVLSKYGLAHCELPPLRLVVQLFDTSENRSVCLSAAQSRGASESRGEEAVFKKDFDEIKCEKFLATKLLLPPGEHFAADVRSC